MGGICLSHYSDDCTHLIIQYQTGKNYEHVILYLNLIYETVP
jgi:hypothetical protein